MTVPAATIAGAATVMGVFAILLSPYVGRKIEAKIIELDKNRNNVVLSRRAYLEQTQSEVRTEFLNKLQKGQVRHCRGRTG